jgi:ribosomal protein L37AE/L43A
MSRFLSGKQTAAGLKKLFGARDGTNLNSRKKAKHGRTAEAPHNCATCPANPHIYTS